MSEHEPDRAESTGQPQVTFCTNAPGSWNALESIGRIPADQRLGMGVSCTLMRPNKTGGHICGPCVRVQSDHVRPFEFREDGAKADCGGLFHALIHQGVPVGIRTKDCGAQARAAS